MRGPGSLRRRRWPRRPHPHLHPPGRSRPPPPPSRRPRPRFRLRNVPRPRRCREPRRPHRERPFRHRRPRPTPPHPSPRRPARPRPLSIRRPLPRPPPPALPPRSIPRRHRPEPRSRLPPPIQEKSRPRSPRLRPTAPARSCSPRPPGLPRPVSPMRDRTARRSGPADAPAAAGRPRLRTAPEGRRATTERPRGNRPRRLRVDRCGLPVGTRSGPRGGRRRGPVGDAGRWSRTPVAAPRSAPLCRTAVPNGAPPFGGTRPTTGAGAAAAQRRGPAPPLRGRATGLGSPFQICRGRATPPIDR